MSLPSSPPHPLASMSVKQIQYLPCRRSLSHSRKVGPAVAYQPTVVAMPPLTLPPLQGPQAQCAYCRQPCRDTAPPPWWIASGLLTTPPGPNS